MTKTEYDSMVARVRAFYDARLLGVKLTTDQTYGKMMASLRTFESMFPTEKNALSPVGKSGGLV